MWGAYFSLVPGSGAQQSGRTIPRHTAYHTLLRTNFLSSFLRSHARHAVVRNVLVAACTGGEGWGAGCECASATWPHASSAGAGSPSGASSAGAAGLLFGKETLGREAACLIWSC